MNTDNEMATDLKDKIYNGSRISAEEALSLFSWDLLELGKAGDMRRKLIHPGNDVGFIIDRIINYTNVCSAACRFCAFHARAGTIEPYTMTMDEILEKITALKTVGGTQVMLQGGIHPEHTLDTYLDMVSTVKKEFPRIVLHSFSPTELYNMAQKSGLSLDDLLSALKKAGLDSVPGASDLLVDRIRKSVSPNKINTAQWCDVIKALHRNGLKSSATMTYGMGETLKERIDHLMVIRNIQDETGIVRAFIPWSFSPVNTQLSHLKSATGVDYLKIVAIARIVLDNIRYIQAGWLTEGLKLGQTALTFGANDMGGVLTEEVVVKAAGITTTTNEQKMIDMIKNAGRTPVQRDSDYQVIKRFQ